MGFLCLEDRELGIFTYVSANENVVYSLSSIQL